MAQTVALSLSHKLAEPCTIGGYRMTLTTHTPLTLDEYAAAMRVTYKTAWNWANKGSIPAKKVGGVWRVDPSALDLTPEGEHEHP